MLTAENRAERLSGIGASEIAAVVGLSPWQSPLDVYEAKVAPLPEPEGNQDTERGQQLEAALVAWCARRRAINVVPNDRLIRHPRHRFCLATPDGFEIPPEGGKPIGTVEVKSPRRAGSWRKPDEDPLGMPQQHLLQAQWQLAACELPRGLLAALVWGELWIYDIEANAELQAALLEAGEAFWRRVERRDPPSPELPGDAAVLGRLVDQTRKDLIVPASLDEASDLARQYKRAKRDEAAAADRADIAKGKLVAMIGPSAGLDLGLEGPRVTFRRGKDSQIVDWQAAARGCAAAMPIADWQAVVARHTATKRGSRRFYVALPGEEDER